MDDENLPQITEEQIKEIANKSTPVKLMESSLASFLQNTFQMAREEDAYIKNIQAEIVSRLPTFKNTEIIALATSASTNKNDLFSKVISPTMGLLTAAQQNELAMRQHEKLPHFNQTNIREINTQTPAAVLQGMQALFNLAEAIKIKEEQFIENHSESNHQ